MQLAELADVQVGLTPADFWLPRTGANVGRPTRTYSRTAIGVKIRRTDILLPDYAYYLFEYLWMNGLWRCAMQGTGMTTLPIEAVRQLQFASPN